jgi:hypothetical protein
MTSIKKNYKLAIHERGNDGTVDFEVKLTEPPSYPTSPIVRPASLSTESFTSSFTVLDEEDTITANLGVSGLPAFLGRKVVLLESENGGAYEPVFGGRCSDLSLGNNISTYSVTVSDELYKLREGRLFEYAEDSTVRLYPPGLKYNWRNNVFTNPTADVKLVRRVDAPTPGTGAVVDLISPIPLPRSVERYIIEDWKKSRVAFRNPGDNNERLTSHIRVRIAGHDYSLFSFEGGEINKDKGEIEFSDGIQVALGKGGYRIRVSIRYRPEDPPIPAFPLPAGLSYIHAPTAPPSSVAPLHVGSFLFTPTIYEIREAPHEWGISNPISVLKKIFDHFNVSYNTSNFEEYEAAFAGYYFSDRITGPVDPISWIDSKILEPLGLVIGYGPTGELSLNDFRLVEDLDIDVDELYTFSHANTRAPYPTWDHTQSEMVTDVVFSTSEYDFIEADYGAISNAKGKERERLDSLIEDSSSADLMEPVEDEQVYSLEDFEHFTFDGVEGVPRREVVVDLSGYTNRVNPRIPELTFNSELMNNLRDQILFENFNRYGFGPIRSRIYGFESAKNLRPPQIVKLDLDAYPNVGANARGGTRLVQITASKQDVNGPVFDVLDLGPVLNPLATPTLALSANAVNPRNNVDYALTNIVPGATVIVEASFGNTTSWAPILTLPPEDSASPSGTFGELPAGTLVYFRAYQIKENRLRSDYSVTQSITTGAIPAPTGLTGTVEGRSVILDWTTGSEDYMVMPVIQVESEFKEFLYNPLPVDSTRFVFTELGANTAYTLGVKHVDGYGGSSPVASVNVTTGTARELRAPRKLVLRQARSAVTDAMPVAERIGGFGFEVSFSSYEFHAGTLVQVSSSLDFSEVLQELQLPPGSNSTYIFTPYDDVVRYIRLAHVREGFQQSEWTPVVKGLPTALLAGTDGFDGFPSGYAFLSLTEENEVVLNAGSDDADTDGLYYTLSTEGFIDPIDEDFEPVDEAEFIDKDDFPFSEATEVELFSGESAFLWVRFWNEETGFAPTAGVKHKITVAPESAPASIQLRNFREISRTEETVTYAWERGSRVNEVWVYDNLVDLPQPDNPWPDEDDFPSSTLPVGTDTYTVQIPEEEKARFLQFEPRTETLKSGPVWRVLVGSEGTSAVISLEKVLEEEDRDEGVGRLSVKVLDPDEVSTNLLYRYKSGAGDFSELILVQAEPAHESEHTRTVEMVEGHLSFIEFWLQFSVAGKSGVVIVSSAGFDAGEIPNITVKGHVRQSGNVFAQVSGDFDTKSVKVKAWKDEAPGDALTQLRAETALNGREVTVGDLLDTPLEAGERAVIWALGYSEVNGGGLESSEVAKDEVELRHITPAYLVSILEEEDRGVTPPVGRFHVRLEDPDDVAVQVDYRTKKVNDEGETTTSPWVLETGDPEDQDEYDTRSVDLIPKHVSQISFRVTSNIAGEQIVTYLDSPPFDLGQIPDVAINVKINDEGQGILVWSGDFDTKSIRWVAWLNDDAPADIEAAVLASTDIEASRAGELATGITAITPGDEIHAAVIGFAKADGTGYRGELEKASAFFREAGTDIIEIDQEWLWGGGASESFFRAASTLSIFYDFAKIKSVTINYGPFSDAYGGEETDPGDGTYTLNLPDGIVVAEAVKRASNTSLIEDWPADYPLVQFTVVGYPQVDAAGTAVAEARVVTSPLSSNPGTTAVKGETVIAGKFLNIGSKLALKAGADGPEIEFDDSAPWTVEEGGTGLDAVTDKALLIGDGTATLDLLGHPLDGTEADPLVLGAWRVGGTNFVQWVEQAALGILGGEGIEVTGTTTKTIAFKRYNTSIESPQTGMGNLTLSSGERIAVELGDGANQAAPGNHSVTSHPETGLTAGHVLRATGSAVYGFGTLAAEAFADNTIAPSRLTNISQNQVLGRTATGSGAVSAIATSALTGLDAGGVTTGSFHVDRIPNLPASKITSGILSVQVGGTGRDSLTAGSLMVGAGIDQVALIPPGDNTQLLGVVAGAWTAVDAPSLNVVGGNGIEVTGTTTKTVAVDVYAGTTAERGAMAFVSGQLAVVLGTTAFTALAGNWPSTMSITAGTGLTGGGDFTTPRSLSLTGQALAFHNLGSNGVVVRTSAGVVAARSIGATSGVTVTNGDGVAGNPTLTLTGQALALHNLGTNGFIARTGAGTVAARSLSEGTGIDITNADGVSGNPSIAVEGNIGKVTVSGSAPGGTPSRAGDLHFVV